MAGNARGAGVSTETPRQMLQRLPFVEWDRGIVAETVATVFGWIQRHDGKRDFVYLEFDRSTSEVVWWATSSAKYSRQITDALVPGTDHFDCKPFETVLQEMLGGRSVSHDTNS